MSGIRKPNIRPIILFEAAIALSIFVILMVFDQALVAKSIFTGFICFSLPTIFFTLRMWRYTGAKYARQVARSFYIAEMGKYGLTVVCFAASFILLQPLEVSALFAAYVFFAIIHQIALFRMKR